MKDIEAIYPLSKLQERLLPGSDEPTAIARTETHQLICRLHGPLNYSRFEQAWRQVVERQTALRTSFVWRNVERPLQVVHSQLKGVTIEQHDTHTLSQLDDIDDLYEILAREAARVINPAKAPLLRPVLCRVDDVHYLICNYARLMLDEHSVRLVLAEIFAEYEQLQNQSDALLEPACQFPAYLEWLNQQDASTAREFWKQSLNGFEGPTVLEAGWAASENARPATRFARQRLLFGGSETAAILSFRREHEFSLQALAIGVWMLLLSRYVDREKVACGVGVSGRPANLDGARSMIGPFADFLPLQVRVNNELPALAWLKGTQASLDALQQHAFYPPATIPECCASGSTFIESVLLVEEEVDASAWGDNAGLTVSDVRVSRGNAPLEVRVATGPESGIIALYDAGRYDGETIRRILDHCRNLLREIIEEPARRVSELSMLDEVERRRLLVEWNNTEKEYPRSRCIHDLFEEQVRKTPGAIAVTFGEVELSYGELNERANRLARYLRNIGVGPEITVALCVERSVEMIVGLLAILKAGGAYVPLDPEYPLERLSFMLGDMQAPVLLTQEHLVERLPAHWGQVIMLDSDAELWASEAGNDLANVAAPENLAYMTYTSGSTGEPKGVQIMHRAVVRLVSEADYAALASEEVFLQLAPLAFDASTFEIWGSLLNGARLVVMTPRTPSLKELTQTIDHHRVTTMWLTAGLFHLMVDEQLDGLKPLNQLLAGGDILSVPHVEKVRRHLPALRLVNGYGPTESTTFACCYTVPALGQLNGSVPIGRPITNTRVYLLDHLMRPVPVGVAGELFIGGDGLARGYQRRPELTAERFVPDPYAVEPGARLYRTGDLARYRTDGNIEFLGRLDNQLKIAGHRIEPGEVEIALSQHYAVKQCVVVALESVNGSRRMAAYVVPAAGVAPATSELRAFLADKLPEFMLPAAFIIIDSLPLTAHGKIDRAALPHPSTVASESSVSFLGPRTDEERALAEIWTEVLGVDKVGINDNFFELGGDSMRCIQVLSKAERRGLRLSLQQLFDHQTIAALAEVVEVDTEHAPPPALEPFSLVAEMDRDKLPGDLDDAYPLAALQLGMLFHSEYSPGSAFYHDIFSLHLQAPFDENALREATQSLVARHAILRTSFELSAYSEPLQLVHSQAGIPIATFDVRHLPAAEQDAALGVWFEAEKLQHFDWRRAPLLRLTVHRRSEQTFQLGVSFHHAILDGWSIATLLSELFRLYFSLVGEDVGQLEPPPASRYRDFIALERAALASAEARRYWSEKLDGSPASRLPRWPNYGNTETRGRTVMTTVPISAEVTAGLRRLAATAATPLKSVLLAAHLRMISLLTGQADVLTGVVAYTRPEAADGDRVLGLFLNTIPFRMDLSVGTWLDLVRQTFKAEQEAMRFRHYPMAQVQRERGGRLFETAFNYTHFHVYQPVRELKAELLLDEKVFAETELPFWSNFDLDASTSGIHLGLTIDADQFAMDQAASFAVYYANTLAAMAADPDGRYERANLLPSVERQRLLAEWNDTYAGYERDQFFHRLFERQAALKPATAAVVFEKDRLTYGELNARANQLARHLQQLDAGPETTVAIYLDRSVDMLVALLGILKAGGAYVPVDPSQPIQRLEFIIGDSQAEVVVTREHFRAAVLALGRRTICIDTDWEDIARNERSDLSVLLSPRNIAYLIYTSGSTGQPKGTMIEHRSLTNLTVNHPIRDTLQNGETLRVGLNAPLIFDASVEEIVQLAYGHTLYIVPDDARRDAEALLSYIRSERLDEFECTPSLLKVLLAAGLGRQPALEPRVLLVGGEPLDASTWSLAAANTQTSFYNIYGPTECTVDATACLISRERSFPSIGRPLANTRVYVLNPDLELVPIGTPGELYIAGEGLARGYRSRPDLTAERFLPNPFATEPGERMYATGDAVRYLPDGHLEFVGRLDDQIKLRGFRIEPGEISDALQQHPLVHEALVIAREDAAGDQRLVAYVVADGQDRSLETELRDFLQAKVPAYMLPASYVFLDAMPLTINGKVDRRALPAPGTMRSEAAGEFVAPQDQIERLMASIWEEVLEVRPVGAQDNFFQLGGHSLSSIRLMALIEQQFGRKLALSDLFRGPTVRELAKALHQEERCASGNCLVPLRKGGSGQPLFLVHPTGGSVFCYNELASHLDLGRPVYGLQAQGIDDGLEPHTSVESMAARCRNGLMQLQAEGPYFLAGWSLGGAIAFEIARQLQSAGHDVALLALLDTRAPSPGLSMPDELTLIGEFAAMLGIDWQQMPLWPPQVSGIPAEQCFNWLTAELRVAGLLPADLSTDQLQRLFIVYRAHVQAGLDYKPGLIMSRVILMKARGVSAEGDYTAGWQRFAPGGTDIYEVPGTHHTMLREPHVAILAQCLEECMALPRCLGTVP